MMMLPFIAGLIGFGVVLLVVPLIVRRWGRAEASGRSVELHHAHRRPVPRLGGMALAAAFLAIEAFITLVEAESREATPHRGVILVSCLAMFGLGLWDDFRALGARKKLLGQVLIALMVYCFGLGIQMVKIPFAGAAIDLHGWGAVVTVFWLVGMTNLINLIDGADGVAAGICLMLMVLLAYVGHEVGSFERLTAGMAGALVGFLWFNFPPARIYLGDGGAYFLGFQIGLFSLVNSHKGEVFAALAAPMLALALPILDTSVAIARRGLWGLPIFRPDRRHLHHQLQRIGYSRRRVVLSFYAVTLVFFMLGAAAVWSRGQWLPGLVGFGALVLVICAGNLSFSREWFDVGRVLGHSLELRREIQYALSLTRWLELEGGRQATVEELWEGLAFAARKLGFASVKLTLADGQRVWARPETGGAMRSVQQEIDGGESGVLELRAPACEGRDAGCGQTRAAPACERGSLCPCVGDAKMFEVVSELLAEGWLKAVQRWRNGKGVPVCFGSQRAASALQGVAVPGPVPALVLADPSGGNGNGEGNGQTSTAQPAVNAPRRSE